jgi:CubicO group peptidase (beta-lactamase class C family)
MLKPQMPALIPGVLLVLALGAGPARAQTSGAKAFTPDKPENHGLSTRDLVPLTEEMDRLVTDKRLVGAEIVVLKDRRIVLQATAGWKDRESGARMVPNTIFSLRAMTRPLIGLAAQVLIDDGRLSPGDKVSRYLPSFAQGPFAGVTVEELLTQRSGLPKVGGDRTDAATLQALAGSFASLKPAFSPGADFVPSEPGADALAAVVEKAAGTGLADFIQKRLLGPLRMGDTFVFTDPADARASRIASGYVGTAGNWNRNWSPADGPAYRFAQGSQSYFSTPLDYARLLSLVLDGGRFGGRALLSPAAVKRLLTPISSVPADTGFSGVRLAYGQMMQVMVAEAGSGTVAFGQNSPEGMLAWAWPGRDIIVLFFTQTRGVRTEVAIEAVMDRVLIHPGQSSDVPAAFRPFLGKYVDPYGPTGVEEISIVYLNGRLALDVPNQAVFVLEPPDAQGRFALARNAAIALSFVRNDRGEVVALRRHQGERSLDIPRQGTPEARALLDKARKAREEWKKYAGVYQLDRPGQTVEIVEREGSLGLLRQGQTAPLLLRPPDAEGRWRFRGNPSTYVTFQENATGAVVSFTIHTAGGQTLVRPRVGDPED